MKNEQKLTVENIKGLDPSKVYILKLDHKKYTPASINRLEAMLKTRGLKFLFSFEEINIIEAKP